MVTQVVVLSKRHSKQVIKL